MKKAKDILREMAFNDAAPESTKRAFMHHLQKAMNESKKAEVVPMPDHESDAKQLSFDLGEIKDFQSIKEKKKSS